MPSTRAKSREAKPKLRRRTKRRLTWAAAAVAGIVAAVMPARRAARLNVLTALQYE